MHCTLDVAQFHSSCCVPRQSVVHVATQALLGRFLETIAKGKREDRIGESSQISVQRLHTTKSIVVQAQVNKVRHGA
jgi:hypothetical protein